MNKLLLIGGYTYIGDSEGIYTVQMDTQTGLLSTVDVCRACENPSFLAQRGNSVFAVHELFDRGCIASYRLESGGKLRLMHREDMAGGLMCHLNIWPGERFLSATNYWTGSIAVCPISSDGIAGAPVAFEQYSGKGINPQRQEGPHTHSSVIDPSGKWLLCAELGIDRIFVYGFDPETGSLVNSAATPEIKAPDGSGPRHFSFHPNGRNLYVSTELSNEVLAYRFEPETGTMVMEQRISTLPEEYKGDNLAADIHCDPGGRYLYVSNRGHDSIAVFRIQENGTLVRNGFSSCYGNGPRSFTLLDGWILIANQGSGNVAACKIGEDGMPGELAANISISQASYILPLEGI